MWASRLIVPSSDEYNGGQCGGARKAAIIINGGGHCPRQVVLFYFSIKCRINVGTFYFRILFGVEIG